MVSFSHLHVKKNFFVSFDSIEEELRELHKVLLIYRRDIHFKFGRIFQESLTGAGGDLSLLNYQSYTDLNRQKVLRPVIDISVD